MTYDKDFRIDTSRYGDSNAIKRPHSQLIGYVEKGKHVERSVAKKSTVEKVLGVIDRASFGHCGYQESMLGIEIVIIMDGFGIVSEQAIWDYEKIECDDRKEWTEADRDAQAAVVMRFVSKLLNNSGVDCVSKLAGTPVEVTLEEMKLKKFRVLTECIDKK